MTRRLVILIAGLIAAAAAGRWLAGVLGLDPDRIHATISSVGAWAPVLYVLVLTARHLIALPSSLALTIGGGLFPVETATIAGATGLFLSAMIDFWIFRVAKPKRLLDRLAARSDGAARLAERSTPLVLIVATAVPPLPQTMTYFAAAMTEVSYTRFAAIVGPCGIPRALVLALLGGGIVSGNIAVTALAIGTVVAACGIAMASPTLRSVLLSPRREE